VTEFKEKSRDFSGWTEENLRQGSWSPGDELNTTFPGHQGGIKSIR
jgi:hypothetical protein